MSDNNKQQRCYNWHSVNVQRLLCDLTVSGGGVKSTH